MRGCIMKHPKTEYWQIKWYETGPNGLPRQRQKSCKGMSQKEAEKELRRIMFEVDGGDYIEPDKQTVAEYLYKWINYSGDAHSELTTLRYTGYVKNNVAPRIGSIRLDKLRPLHLQKLYKTLLDSGRVDGRGGLSTKTVHDIHGILHSALNRAVKWQLLSKNPADSVEPPRVVRTEARSTDRAGVARLLKVIEKSKYRMPVLIGLATGMRRGEITGLRWEDFDEKNRLLIVRRSIGEVPGRMFSKDTKNHRSRIVPIPPTLITKLIEHRKWQQEQAKILGDGYHDNGWICTHSDGKRFTPGSMTKAFTHLAKKAKIDITLHGLRHTQATEQINGGVPSELVAKRIGDTIDITQTVYYHAVNHRQDQAVEIAEQLINPDAKPTIRMVDGDSESDGLKLTSAL